MQHNSQIYIHIVGRAMSILLIIIISNFKDKIHYTKCDFYF